MLASASTSSRPSMPCSQAAYSATDSLWLPAQCAERRDVRQDVPGIAEPVLAGHVARKVRTVLAPDDVRELRGCERPAAANVENLPDRALVIEHEKIGIDNIVDVDVVA